MASVSKLFPRQTDRIGTKFFLTFFFRNQGSDDEKVRQKITMMARGSKDSEKPKNRIGKTYFWSPKFWPKNCPGVSRLFFPKPTHARKHESEIRWISKINLICKELGLVVDIWWWYMAMVVVYGYGVRAVADKQWW